MGRRLFVLLFSYFLLLATLREAFPVKERNSDDKSFRAFVARLSAFCGYKIDVAKKGLDMKKLLRIVLRI